ncbi:MAG: DUF2971 domain-containing protein [Thiogranum sp.]|nr:DUF2971 domain-containing protein [Thiogranum sp.]
MYYHYTSIGSLYEIVKTRKVWFGSLAFMNDKREGFELHSILSRSEEGRKCSADEQAVLDLVDTTIDTFLRFQMAFCATSLKDDISQWRAYTPLGQGVCIEFDDNFIADPDVQKVDCIYELGEKRELLEKEGSLLLNQQRLREFEKFPESVNEYVQAVVKTLPSFKHYSFRPEKEVRWVKSAEGAADPSVTILYRPHRLGLATYTEVEVDLSFVKSVTLGPQVERQNQKTVEDFLIVNECAGYVTKSMSTLR